MKLLQRFKREKNGINHWVLYSLLIVVIALELFFSGSQAYLVLYTPFCSKAETKCSKVKQN